MKEKKRYKVTLTVPALWEFVIETKLDKVDIEMEDVANGLVHETPWWDEIPLRTQLEFGDLQDLVDNCTIDDIEEIKDEETHN